MSKLYYEPTTDEGRLELVEAYKRVFTPKAIASNEDKELVFNDIMIFSGFFNVSPSSEQALQYKEGSRSVGGLIFSMVKMPQRELDSLYKSVRAKQIGVDND